MREWSFGADAQSTMMDRTRFLHVTAEAAEQFGLPPARFGLFGQVMGLSHTAAGEWAARVRAKSRDGATASGFAAGELLAAVALHELMHALVSVESGEGAANAGALQRAQAAATAAAGERELMRLAELFRQEYVTATVQGQVATGEALLEELLLLDLAHLNPALEPLRALFRSRHLGEAAAYGPAVAAVRGALSTGSSAPSLVDLLEEPQTREPLSLTKQLELALKLWGPRLTRHYPAALAQAATALGVLAEEARPGWGPPGPPAAQPGALVRDDEPEAYSADAAWMKGVVLVAKSTYVWLAQLSQRYSRQVERLDQVPDEALAELAAHGFNALWLIGVWWRSDASRTIKRLRGQDDALASAYSVKEYLVAPELGGEAALEVLRERAARHGIKLASDMVPNHTAIDSTWVAEHPERFVQLSEPPYPGYSYTGPDLSTDARLTLRIEDHYYDGTDAAVVFQRVDNRTGAASYIYHGNDGTALPWNDTAQLDFLSADVRRAVIATTVAVARRFPLIRLDAAMTLARKHFRRLWHPLPGEAGAVPSRAALALPQAEFDRLLPSEFWRELVDALALEAPGTMLLAEAFWLMEVYFVRSLGMNRVYNSAFMHMTMQEQNAEYRAYLKRYLAEAPQVLARFVNYMSNPDEETAADQYGHGDKAFGVAALMATLPGLPMFGHGQVEGLREKYGMEFARPRTDEQPLPWHAERHLNEIAPLLARRLLFAGSELFRLFDLTAADGSVEEDVYAFVNGAGAERVLVLHNNSPRPVAGRLGRSAAFRGADGEQHSEALHEALGVASGAAGEVVLSTASGSETRLPASDLAEAGMWVELGAYEARVYTRVRLEVPAQAEPGGPVVRATLRPVTVNPAVLTGRRRAAIRLRAMRRRR